MVGKKLANIRKHLERIFRNPDTVTIDELKIGVIREYTNKYKCGYFIETGTYLGGTTKAVCDQFQEAWTIELDEQLHLRAKHFLKDIPHVHCCLGDSASQLSSILPHINGPILYWLDAHYSRGITALGDEYTPISRELNVIFQHSYCKDSVILIDDARCFNGTEDYPSIDYVRDQVRSHLPDAQMIVSNDIIRISKQG